MTHDHPACAGTNCGITSYQQEHSPECVAEHAAACAPDHSSDAEDAARFRALVAHKISLTRTEGQSLNGSNVNWAGSRPRKPELAHLPPHTYGGANTALRGDFVQDDRPPITEMEALREAVDQVVRDAARTGASSAKGGE